MNSIIFPFSLWDSDERDRDSRIEENTFRSLYEILNLAYELSNMTPRAFRSLYEILRR